jgi:tetratricopeptide (TPR) repeat protein
MDVSRRRIEIYSICAILIAVVLVSYWGAFHNGFVYDDSGYILRNYPIQRGLTPSGLAWAFTSFHTANWHPITWVSHMIDCGNYDANVTGHHLTSILLHLANTLLLFAVLFTMTNRPWRSAFVAALFAAHPLHVESVAWISERKDVLSTLFGLLAILAYVGYVRKPRIARYLLMAVFFALGLMSKPMLVTLPIMLILLDYWPLDRMGRDKSSLRRLILEKAPLFAMSAASSYVALLAQRANSSIAPTAAVPVGQRLDNAAVSYVVYIRKMLWPSDLAVFYPHPLGSLHWWIVAGSLALLLGLSLAAIALRSRRYLLVGWLWYLVTLIPVIGIVQVGGQAMADRYTYIPLIGLFIIVAWALPDLIPGKRFVAIMACAAVLATCSVIGLTRSYVRCWKSDLTLFSQAARVTRNNWVAQNQLACSYVRMNKPRLALPHARQAVSIQPYNPDSYTLLGLALTQLKRFDEAIAEFQNALDRAPDSSLAHSCLADAFRQQGKFEQAREEAETALSIDASNVIARDVLRRLPGTTAKQRTR